MIPPLSSMEGIPVFISFILISETGLYGVTHTNFLGIIRSIHSFRTRISGYGQAPPKDCSIKPSTTDLLIPSIGRWMITLTVDMQMACCIKTNCTSAGIHVMSDWSLLILRLCKLSRKFIFMAGIPSAMKFFPYKCITRIPYGLDPVQAYCGLIPGPISMGKWLICFIPPAGYRH